MRRSRTPLTDFLAPCGRILGKPHSHRVKLRQLRNATKHTSDAPRVSKQRQLRPTWTPCWPTTCGGSTRGAGRRVGADRRPSRASAELRAYFSQAVAMGTHCRRHRRLRPPNDPAQRPVGPLPELPRADGSGRRYARSPISPAAPAAATSAWSTRARPRAWRRRSRSWAASS